MKVFFIVPSVMHYRETFFEKLVDANSDLEWLIIDGEKKVDDGRPNNYRSFNFPHIRFEERFMQAGVFSLRDYVGLFDFVVRENPDLVIVPAIPGTTVYRRIAKLARKKKLDLIVWSCLWEHARVRRSVLRFAKNLVYRRFLQSAAFHLAYSSFAKRRLVDLGCAEDKISVAFNGIEIEGLEQLKLTKERRVELMSGLQIRENSSMFLYVGGLGADKRVDLLLEAVKRFKRRIKVPFVVLIVGSGPMEKSLKQYTVDNGLESEVVFIGRVVEGVDEYFQLSDCLVMPGAGGLALNQAMFWQKVCIVSHADGTEEDLISESVTGFRFSEGSSESLCDAMFRFMHTSKEILDVMGSRAKKLVKERSNVDEMVRTFTETIRTLRLTSERDDCRFRD